jgi:beta-lactamase regulating signal transducer with metallopeptidase domain
MNQLWTEIAFWWLRLAFAGGLLLLAGWALVAVCRQPARRLRVGSWTLTIALLLLPLTMLPGWFELPLPLAAPTQSDSAKSPTTAPSHGDSAKAPEESFALEQSAKAPVESSASAQFVITPKVVQRVDAPEIALEPPVIEETEQPQKAAREPLSGVGEVMPNAANARIEKQQSPAVVAVWACNVMLVVYGLIVAVLLGRLALGQFQLMRLWHSGRKAPVEIRQLFRRISRRSHCYPVLRVSDRVAGPICFGLIRPKILLPSQLANVADEKALRWIFAHELSHLERRDPLVGWLIGLAQSVFFFLPWFWKLRREVRLNQEYLADASAVRMSKKTNAFTPAEDYADFLVRLTSAGKIPLNASGVKSPSSDLYRRITMLLQKSGNVESTCPRRCSYAAGFGLLALGLILAGFQLSAKADPEPKKDSPPPTKKEEPAKKESVEDVEKEVQQALDALKKGPAASPRKEEKDNNGNAREPIPDDEVQKAWSERNKARKASEEDPKSAEKSKAAQEAELKYRNILKNRMMQNGAMGPIQDVQEIQRMLEQAQRQMMLMPMQPLPGGMGGMQFAMSPFGGRLLSTPRLGIRMEKPTPALVEQLDLPANKGIVVTEVLPNTPAAKAGIKANDILLEVGGKPVPSELVELQALIRDVKADQKFEVVLLRKGKKETLKDVVLPEVKEIGLQRAPFPGIPVPFPPQGQGFQVGGRGVRQSVQVSNNDFTIKHGEDGFDITIVGTKEDGKAKVTSIVVEANGKTTKAESVDKVDEQYRPLVERLLKQIR